jgi:hypothetical protein
MHLVSARFRVLAGARRVRTGFRRMVMRRGLLSVLMSAVVVFTHLDLK